MQDVQKELEEATREARGNAAEVYKLRGNIDEHHDSMEALRRENKNLTGWFLFGDYSRKLLYFR